MTIKITVDIAGARKNIQAIVKIGGHFIESQNIPVVFESSETRVWQKSKPKNLQADQPPGITKKILEAFHKPCPM